MRPGELRPRAERAARKSARQQDGRLSQGEVRTRRRMAEVGAVWVITPAPRTTADIVGPGPRAKGPGARHKWLTASVAADCAAVVAAVFAEADRRDPARERTWIALADGNKDQIRQIQAQAAARGITVTIIVDLIHVSEHLWDAAWCLFPRASADAGRPGSLSGLESWYDGAALAQLGGIPCVGYGPPGFDPEGVSVAHMVDEYVPVDGLVGCAQGLAVAAMRFCGTD